MTLRSGVLLAVMAATTAACTQSPNDTFARTVDQAASWAAAADFAAAMRQAGRVPPAYLQDLLEHGAEDLVSLQSKIAKDDDVAAGARSKAAGLCDRLASAFRASTEEHRDPDFGEIRRIGAELRALAEAARSGDRGTAAGASQ